MSLPSQPLPPVPDDTARIARAAFRRCNTYVLLRDRLGAVFADADFADPYPFVRFATVPLATSRRSHPSVWTALQAPGPALSHTTR